MARAIDAGLAADRKLWGSEVGAGVRLEFVLIAWDVATLRAGVHIRAGDGFRRLGAPPDRSARGMIALQQDLQSAPMLLLPRVT